MKSKILAVDDEPQNLKLINGYLANMNFEVITANDGVEAWEILEKRHQEIDVILLDRLMPRMDGMALNEKIKADPGMAVIPVIMQTAAAQPDQMVEGIEAGGYYYLTKPYDGPMLVSLVMAAIREAEEQESLSIEIGRNQKVIGLIVRSDFAFASLEDARDLTLFLSKLYPNHRRCTIF